MDVPARSSLLLERHGSREAADPLHGWWDWYARVHGRSMSGTAQVPAPTDRAMAEVERVSAPHA